MASLRNHKGWEGGGKKPFVLELLPISKTLIHRQINITLFLFNPVHK